MNIRSVFSPKVEIPRWLYGALGAGSVLSLVCLWCVLTYGGITEPDFLAAPHEIAVAGWERVSDASLFGHIGASLMVILSGFALASVLAVPIGILTGSFGFVAAIVEPIAGFMRYIPVSALIPLLILWIGIDIEQKISVIFLGTFFQQLILFADVSARVSRDLIDCSYTLGANRRQVVWRVLLPALHAGGDGQPAGSRWAGPGPISSSPRSFAANSGLGYMISERHARPLHRRDPSRGVHHRPSGGWSPDSGVQGIAAPASALVGGLLRPVRERAPCCPSRM